MQRAAFIMHSKLALMRANGYIATRFFREHDLEHVKKKYVERQGEAVGSYLLLHRLLCCILLQAGRYKNFYYYYYLFANKMTDGQGITDKQKYFLCFYYSFT